MALFAVALLLARLLAGHFVSFFQNDEVSLAAGAAALASHSIGDVYRYGPQVGYYRLVVAMDALVGGHLRAIPLVMIWLSVIAGTIIPLCGLGAFPDLLTRAERWTLAGLLAINPILWMSSTYGNSAMPSTALLVLAVTLLSRNPGRALEVLALALYGVAILVRADAVLATPLITLLLYLRFATVRATLARMVPLGLALAAVYALLFLADERMASTVQAVASHLTETRFTTKFWDYLLWSTSPFILAFAVVGVRDLAAERRHLLAYAIAWCLPFFAFYFATTTSPRYFVSTAVPVALCASVGALGLVRLTVPAYRRLAVAAVSLLATVHLFIGLGHFSPGPLTNLLTQAEFETQVGPLWTGAYIYKSYFTPTFLGRSLRHPRFGRINGTQWALDSSLASVASGAERGHTIVVLLGSWLAHSFHYYAPLHGARYVSRAPGPVYASETWMSLGGARLMSIGMWVPAFQSMGPLPLNPGDQVWLLTRDSAGEGIVRAHLPRDLELVAVGDTARPVRVYRLGRTSP